MRGYFAIGTEDMSKPRNLGNLIRSAHAFGASSVFTVNAEFDRRAVRNSDTSAAGLHVPFYQYNTLASFQLPSGCHLVGVELTDDAIDLPSFRHPERAAYIMGPEKGSLSPAMLKRCEFVVKIPTKFCINVATAGAVLMYDRHMSSNQYAARPWRPGGKAVIYKSDHKHGGVFTRDPIKQARLAAREDADDDL